MFNFYICCLAGKTILKSKKSFNDNGSITLTQLCTAPLENNTIARPNTTLDVEESVAIVFGLCSILIILWLCSIVAMLLTPLISSLSTAYRTAVDLSDASLEQAGAEVSLGITY